MANQAHSDELGRRLDASVPRAVAAEFLNNSGHFPMANLLLEIILEGPAVLLRSIDPAALLLGALVQSWIIGYRRSKAGGRNGGWAWPLFANLAGPLAYTVLEVSVEGPVFFDSLNHQAYWGFSLAVGLLQTAGRLIPAAAAGLSILEHLVRALILLAVYWIIEAEIAPKNLAPAVFFADLAHRYIAAAVVLLGLFVGLADLSARRYLAGLRETTERLKQLSDWAWGDGLVARAVVDPGTLGPARRERVMLFMDIRSFTAWSEEREPEQVVAMLNAYFEAAERAWTGTDPIRTRFIGDEVFLIYADPQTAARAAFRLRGEITGVLSAHGLGAGIGLHMGPVTEGLMGASQHRMYDAMGDTVNTAARVCANAGPGEILVTDVLAAALTGARFGAHRSFTAKGKAQPVGVRALEALADPAAPAEAGARP